MRVLIVSGSAMPLGGAERVAIHSAIRLAERGHQVTVAAAHGPITAELQSVPNLSIRVADPNPMPRMPSFGERLKQVWPSKMGPFLETLLTELKGSGEVVVHFHNGYFEFSVPGFRALARSGIPMVYTHHDYGWACPLTGFYDYTLSQQCGLTGGSPRCFLTDCTNSRVEKLIRFSRHMGTHRVSGIQNGVSEHIFISRTAQQKLMPYLGEGAVFSFLPNATNFEKRPRKPVDSNSKLGFVGRFTLEKDPVALAEAALEAGMQVDFVGEGPLRNRLEELMGSAPVKGWKPQAEIGEILRGARALVLPSRWLEVAPLVLFEAAALGVPVVVPSDTAAAEFVEHERTGLIYDRGTHSSLLNTLIRLKDNDFADALGVEAFQRFWADPPTWEKHLDGLEAVYERVLGKG